MFPSKIGLDHINCSQSPDTDNRDYKQIGFMVPRPKEPLVDFIITDMDVAAHLFVPQWRYKIMARISYLLC